MLRSYQGLEVLDNCSGWMLLSNLYIHCTIETLLNERPSSNDKCYKYEAFGKGECGKGIKNFRFCPK